MQIKIYHLSQNIDDKALERLFMPFGVVTSAIVERDTLNGRSRGHALVEMPVEKDARQAILSLDQVTIDGKKIAVSEWITIPKH